MQILLAGRNANNIKGLVQDLGFEIVTKNPDVIISYGGDGTLLSSEREYPAIPKLPIRDSLVCKKCPIHENEVVLKNFLDGKLTLNEYKKLETTLLYKNFFALNDFVIRNIEPTHTIRFKILQKGIAGKLYIGDGIVLATPFGSTGYFKSITKTSFKKGFALTFNNTTEKEDPIYLKEDDQIGFQLIRGKATLTFDNSPDLFTIDEGSELTFKLSDQTAGIYEADTLRCPNCQIMRG